MNDYGFYDDVTISSEKCSNNDKAYLWLIRKEHTCWCLGIYIIGVISYIL
jgi:hypothetical protein